MTDDKKEVLAPAIHRVRLDQLTIFEITEAELEALERGSPESLFLNLAVATLSIALSFSVSLLTTTIPSIKIFSTFVVIATITYVSSITFGLLWWQSRKSLKSVAREIRKRMPPKGIQEDSVQQIP